MQKKSGRPKGSINGVRTTDLRKWEPRKWKIEHEMCVLMHVSGKSNKEISGITGKGEMWVSLVITSKRALEIIEGIRKRLPVGEIVERYQNMLDVSIKRMEDYIGNDKIAESTPGAMFDRAARLAEMIDSRLKGANGGNGNNSNNVTNNNVIFASEESVGRLLNALDKSSEVTKKHRTLGLIGGHSGSGEVKAGTND